MNKIFSGGGVLPIITIEKEGLLLDCFICFSSKKGIISDAGGKCDTGEDIMVTSRRELFEESCKLFDIDLVCHKFIDITCGRTFYRCYLLKLDNQINSRYFTTNRITLEKEFCRSHFLEKTDIVFIPINCDMNIDHLKKLYLTKDVMGNRVIIGKRLFKIIRNSRIEVVKPNNINLQPENNSGIVTYKSL